MNRISAYTTSGDSLPDVIPGGKRQAGDEAPPFELPGDYGSRGDRPRAVCATLRRNVSDAWCRAYRFPVKLDADSDEVFEVYGELATLEPLTEDTTLQVLLAGGSNNGSYWDWPLDPDAHSYVRHATRAGFATLNLDRPGYGKSDRPDPAKLDFTAQARVVHQVVQYFRQGYFGPRFGKIVLNGHSMGGMVAWHAASRFKTADAVIVSGVGHNLSAEAMQAVIDNVQPVESHPKYGTGLGWLPGYFARRMPSVPPDNVSDLYTLLLQDTVMSAELASMLSDSLDLSLTKGIDVPVLFALGRHDRRWCTTTGDCATDPAFLNEASYYVDAKKIDSFLIPDAGHLINKDPGAVAFFEKATNWLRERGF